MSVTVRGKYAGHLKVMEPSKVAASKKQLQSMAKGSHQNKVATLTPRVQCNLRYAINHLNVAPLS
jgi:hypothetical protein